MLLIHPYFEHGIIRKLDSTIYFKQRNFKTQVFVQLKLHYFSFIHSFIQYSVWRQVQSLLQNDAST